MLILKIAVQKKGQVLLDVGKSRVTLVGIVIFMDNSNQITFDASDRSTLGVAKTRKIKIVPSFTSSFTISPTVMSVQLKNSSSSSFLAQGDLKIAMA